MNGNRIGNGNSHKSCITQHKKTKRRADGDTNKSTTSIECGCQTGETAIVVAARKGATSRRTVLLRKEDRARGVRVRAGWQSRQREKGAKNTEINKSKVNMKIKILLNSYILCSNTVVKRQSIKNLFVHRKKMYHIEYLSLEC